MTFDKKLPAKLNRKIGRAMHDYTMFSHGDRVIVAVSGGVDSLTLACILHLWTRKAPVSFELIFVHIDHGFWKALPEEDPAVSTGQQLQRLGITLNIYPEWKMSEERRTCFSCSRNRRSQLFDLARSLDCNKIAFGHHKDDLVETFFLNTIYSGNISTMKPRQDLFGGTLSLVRPMSYLEKSEVMEIAGIFGLNAVKNLCPLAENSRREKVRALLQDLLDTEPGARDSVFAALSNIREEYLL